jgi:hypothetical protein
MWTAENVKDYVKNYGFKFYGRGREIKSLHKILIPNETILALLSAYFKKLHNTSVYGYGIVIATNTRIIFYKKSFFGIINMYEIPLNKLSSISYKKGLFFSTITIITSGLEIVVSDCRNKVADKFTKVVQNTISNMNSNSIS